jgi:F0F1-type ATP synthase membrane subunit b/b'
MGAEMKAQRQDAIDPAVADLLGSLERKQTERSKPLAERKRRAKEREKAAARNRVMLDLPTELVERMVTIADRLQVPTSHIAAALIAHGLADYGQERLNLSPYIVLSNSPRFPRLLNVAEMVHDFLQGTPL